MTSVLLATFDLMPDGEPGAAALTAALGARGIDSRWVCWDDPAVDWAGADLVAIRSTWDYHRRLPAFLDWARAVEASTTLLNGAGVVAWNADKAYLAEIADVVPVVPTALLDDADLAAGLAAALDRWGSVVVKPRTGAGGIGVVVVERLDDPRLEGLVAGPWIAQPLVDSIRTTGESSVYVFDGVAASQVDKTVAAGEIRAHELHGGSNTAVALDPERAAVATAAVRAVAERRGADLAYARVDLLRWQDSWVVSELELIEPGLYLDVDPANGERFAALVAGRLGRS
ncbi:hypothetical protein ABFU82_14220 [Nocardioides sp. WV_118_6]|uniref:hypothetical protein n=1 Tax=Nocardioides simplex TaxID=2045 RepID=UPI00215044F9|nr:hypothetical protein [Pimelobacter simplex]UUW89850.1 hypothetical protein M0M43_29595 [Pimelobacter simplex]UUW93679.1 hypothetical protein M0M48_18250 [Pimelobacter simplex]